MNLSEDFSGDSANETNGFDVTARLKEVIEIVNQSGARFKEDGDGHENSTALDSKLRASFEEKHFKEEKMSEVRGEPSILAMSSEQ